MDSVRNKINSSTYRTMKRNLLLLLLLLNNLGHAQELPWYFNTHSFRSWAVENNVRSLLLPVYFETHNQSFYGLSHQTYFEMDSWITEAYSFERAYFVHYSLDTSGYVEKAASMDISLIYQLADTSGKATERMRTLMEAIAVGNMPAFRVDTVVARAFLGSTHYLLGKRTGRSINPDGTHQVIGEKITDRHGVTYRENAINVYDSLLGFHFGYDKTLLKVIHYNRNIAVAACDYWFMGDCYDPISIRETFVPVSDSISELTCSGVTNLNPCYLQPVDTVFTLPAYAFRQSVGPEATESYVQHLARAHHAGVSQYGGGQINVRETRNRYIPLVRNKVFRYKDGGSETVIHSIAWDGRTKTDALSDFRRSDRYRRQSSGMQFNQTIRTMNRFYSTGILKQKAYAVYDTIGKNWVQIGTESYNKSGQLKDLNFKWWTMHQFPWEAMERDDLGFLARSGDLDEKVSVQCRNGEVLIASDEEVLVQAGRNELLIANIPVFEAVYRYSGEPEYDCRNYCTYQLKVVR